MFTESMLRSGNRGQHQHPFRGSNLRPLQGALSLLAAMTLASCRLVPSLSSGGALGGALTGGRAGQGKQAFLLGAPEVPGEAFFFEDFRELVPRLRKAGFALSGAVGSRARVWGPDFVAFDAHLAWGQLEKSLSRAKAGEEFLLVIHSHGRDRYVEAGQRTHSISGAVSGAPASSLGGAALVDLDLDRLFPLFQSAQARGVRVGFVDLSCYSGESQRLRSVASCVLTLAAPGYVSLCSGREEERGFSSFFVRGDQPKPLRTRFLEARLAEEASVNLPALSEFEPSWSAQLSDLLLFLDPLDLSESMQSAKPRPPSKKTRSTAVFRDQALEEKAQAARATRVAIDRELEALSKFEKDHRISFVLPRAGRVFAQLSPVTLEEWLARIEEGALPHRGNGAGSGSGGGDGKGHRTGRLRGAMVLGAPASTTTSSGSPAGLGQGDSAEDSAILDLSREVEAVWQSQGRVLTRVREMRNRIAELQERLLAETEALMKTERLLYDAQFRKRFGQTSTAEAPPGTPAGCEGFSF